MASVAPDDFVSHRGVSSARRSPFQGERTASSSSPFRFPKIQPLPNSSDISYDDDDPDVSQRDVIQVEEEPEGIAATVRTTASDSGNDAEQSADEYDIDEEKKTKPPQSYLTDVTSRKRRDSSTERRNNLDPVSSLLVEPGRKLHDPLRTRILRILSWQLMFSMIICLPFLLIADLKPAILTKLQTFSLPIPVPFLNIITIPITTLFGVILFFDLAFVAYLMLAQTDPPDSVALPFLPWDPKLVWKVNYVLYRWLRVAVRVVPRLMQDWAIRRMLKSKRGGADPTVVYNVHYGSARPRKRLDVYRATPRHSPTDNAGQQFSPQRFASQSPIRLRTSTNSAILPAPGIGRPSADLVLARNNGGDGNTLSPVIVFFHSPQLGPIKGKKWMYESLGRNFAKMGYTVVIPDLTFYPEGKAKQMVQDVRRVLNWTMINIRRYGGDPSQIHVMGHSLGGHLALLTVLQEAIVLSRDKCHDPYIEMANGLRELKIYDRAVRLPQIQGLILLAPICDVNDQIVQEATRGVAHLSKLRRILGPSHTRAMFHSPVHILHAARNVIDLDLLPPKTLFIHGGLDEEVPHFQSELMKEMMHGVGLPFVRCRIYPLGHVDVVTSLMMKQDEPLSSSILDDLADFMAL